MSNCLAFGLFEHSLFFSRTLFQSDSYMNYILKFEGNTINYLDHDILVLLNAISNVDKQYLSYAEYNANAENRKDQIDQLERVFAYELYYQWSLLKDDNMVLNGEIGKLWNDKYWYPDLVLHGGQGDPENNRVVVEIKRECMVKGNLNVILEDFKKLSSFLKSEEKSSQDDCKFRNYKNAVFILLKGKIEEISHMLKAKKVSQDEINGN